MTDPVRIANCSGFYGDRLAAAREMVEDGPIDVLTGDWLAELTMLILFKDRLKNPDGGYAKTFVRQMEQVMGTCLQRGIKVVANAGGLNPQGCARAVETVAAGLGLSPRIAYVTGDDVLPRLGDLGALTNLDTGEPLRDRTVLTANAYLGGWGIVDALGRGADIVITGRTTDAAIVMAPAAHHHGWSRDDWDALAGALVAGHVIECGTQATGGNYAFFTEVPNLVHPGFPIAEIAADGSSVITKHDAHAGQVSTGTVTAQLLYEIGSPRYLNPDVTARFDSITLTQDGTDRVRISGVRGEAPPVTSKVCLNLHVPARRPRHRAEGRPARRWSVRGAPRWTGLLRQRRGRSHPIRPGRPAAQRDGRRPAAHLHEGRRRRQVRPGPDRCDHRAGAGQLPRLLRRTVEQPGLRRLLARSDAQRAAHPRGEGRR
jgi:hypothetical protein